METTTKEEITKVLNKYADLLRDEVKAIEKSRKLTQNHYGKYLSLITTLKDKMPSSREKFWGAVLVIAGANKQGVINALKVLGKI